MKINKIEITNYRLLKNFCLELEDELSLVIGKNNTGKTSILSILSKFLSSKKAEFVLNDFNTDYIQDLKTLIAKKVVEEEGYESMGIGLRIFIEYSAADDLRNISQVMMDLDPDNNFIVLDFNYSLAYDDLLRLKADYSEFEERERNKEEEKKPQPYKAKSFSDFLKANLNRYFKVSIRSLGYNPNSKTVDETYSIDLIAENIKIQDIIHFQFISAKRGVTNKETDKTLSGQTSRIYNRSVPDEDQLKKIEQFQDKLSETDEDLTEIYRELFNPIISKVRNFGGVKVNESEIEIISTLQHRELLEGNTTVVYKHDVDHHLPESYNGLGYMNLISMIFEIEILVEGFKRKMAERPADINLLFIEEPEAHTHPQMQYVFIKNIRKLLEAGIETEDGKWPLQYVISTHSSHIVADSEFDDIKYLKRTENSVTARNLKSLNDKYASNTKQYQFLKQYLTISRAEIFFADKAVLIEGDTERILIPTIMRKIDVEQEKAFKSRNEQDPFLPLLSQNISIIEVGAYSHIFKEFIEFLGIKTLILTDIDSVKMVRNPKTNKQEAKVCPVEEGEKTSNSSLKHYLGKLDWEPLKAASVKERTLKLQEAELLFSYQLKENEYHPRSFEDAFININRTFINDKGKDFKGLKNYNHFEDPDKSPYDLAKDCIDKKTHFALDIIFNSDDNFSNWKIPNYIKEGLLWLKKD